MILKKAICMLFWSLHVFHFLEWVWLRKQDNWSKCSSNHIFLSLNLIVHICCLKLWMIYHDILWKSAFQIIGYDLYLPASLETMWWSSCRGAQVGQFLEKNRRLGMYFDFKLLICNAPNILKTCYCCMVVIGYGCSQRAQ